MKASEGALRSALWHELDLLTFGWRYVNRPLWGEDAFGRILIFSCCFFPYSSLLFFNEDSVRKTQS